MKVLMIGGMGFIGTEVARLCVKKGWDLTVMTRSSRHTVPGAEHVYGDVAVPGTLRSATRGRHFDAVVDFISYEPGDMLPKLHELRGGFDQFIFISSTAVYDRGYNTIGGGLSAIPPFTGKVSEATTPTSNFGWSYARGKIACEHELLREHLMNGVNFTIVRPGETFNERRLPGTFVYGYNRIHRLLKGKPVIVHDDGEALAPFTWSADFAKGFCGIIGNPKAYGQAFHITTDELISWEDTARLAAEALGVEPVIAYVPALELSRKLIKSSLGNTYGVVYTSKHFSCGGYDNSKIKALSPEFICTTSFKEGVGRVIEYYRAHPEACIVDEAWNDRLDALAAEYRPS